MWVCTRSGKTGFIDSSCMKCNGIDNGPCPGSDKPPSPPPAPSPSQCGACARSQDHCYTKYGFADWQCTCFNNDRHCGQSFYFWVCKNDGHTSFVDASCGRCFGMDNTACTATQRSFLAAASTII